MWFEYEISLRMVMKNKNVIAFNARRSGDAMRDGRGYVETWTREQVDDLLRQPWLKQMVEDIHGGDEAKKEQLGASLLTYGSDYTYMLDAGAGFSGSAV